MKNIAQAAAKQANHEQRYHTEQKRNPALSETHEILNQYSEEAIKMAAEEVDSQ